MDLSEDFLLIHDSLTLCIPPQADFLQWTVSEINVDCFSSAPMTTKHGERFYQNHWAIVLRNVDNQQVRVSLEKRCNPKTKGMGVLVVRKLSYSQTSRNTVHRETFQWSPPFLTVQHILAAVLSAGWHKYEMAKSPNGIWRGCRYHLMVMMKGLQNTGWVRMTSVNNVLIEKFLPYVYERDEESHSLLAIEPRDIEEGSFLY